MLNTILGAFDRAREFLDRSVGNARSLAAQWWSPRVQPMNIAQDEAGQIFVSYVHSDEDRVIPVCDWLAEEGFNIWADYRRLKPGQNWDFEIKKALDRADLVIVFVSMNSVDHRGYAQREIRLALDKMSEKLMEDIYLIPVILDEQAAIPEQLRSLHHIRASDGRFREKLADALRYQFGRLGIQLSRTQREANLYWSSTALIERWEGLPGYEAEIQFIDVRSERYSNASEIGGCIRGDLIRDLHSYRALKLAQEPKHYNFGQDAFRRTSTYAAHHDDPYVRGKVLTVRYLIRWYGAGGAHGMHHYRTYPFLLDPLILIPALSVVFADGASALPFIQSAARQALSQVRIQSNPEDDPYGLDSGWIASGTEGWDDFRTFVFARDGLELFFPPYQVGPYAVGIQSASVPYALIRHFLKEEYRTALDIEWA
ncbi:MAG: TIR domain-containing protein [Actinomycetota bacterium]|nr:TIR domain-containing protein [Actinomycetota bacterium]